MTTLLDPGLAVESGAVGAFVVAVMLVGFLIAKEIVISVADPPNRLAAYILDVALAPFLVIFVATIVLSLLSPAS